MRWTMILVIIIFLIAVYIVYLILKSISMFDESICSPNCPEYVLG